MRRTIAALAAMLALAVVPVASLAKDHLVALTLDGRPVDRAGGNAVWRAGVVYADTVDITKSFNGLYSFQKGGGAIITIGANTGTFQPATLRASINKTALTMPGKPFVRDGEIYVPLDFFIRHMTDAKVQINAAKTHADIRVNANPLS